MVKYAREQGGDLFGDIMRVAKPVTGVLAGIDPRFAPIAGIVSMIPEGGSLAEKHHKVTRFNTTEWEHIREAAKQKLREGRPSSHWMSFGTSGVKEDLGREPYLDIVRSWHPSVAARILQKKGPRAEAFGAALSDSVKHASKFVYSRVKDIGQNSMKAAKLAAEEMPKLVALGSKAVAAIEKANEVLKAAKTLKEEWSNNKHIPQTVDGKGIY